MILAEKHQVGCVMDIGSFVVATMIDPKEQFWGRLLSITAAGVVIRGIDAKLTDQYTYQVGKPEQEVFAQTQFIPARRLMSIWLDEAQGIVPSIAQRIRDHSSLDDDGICGMVGDN